MQIQCPFCHKVSEMPFMIVSENYINECPICHSKWQYKNGKIEEK